MIVYTEGKIMWAPFKFEEEEAKGNNLNMSHTPRSEEEILVIHDIGTTKQVSGDGNKNYYIKSQLLETAFKSVFANMEGELPEFLQILEVNFEGFFQKEINVVVECEQKVIIFRLQPIKLRKFTIFKMVEKFSFDKIRIGIGFRELIHSFKIVNISESESVYLMTKGLGELVLLTEKDVDSILQATVHLTKVAQTQRSMNLDIFAP